MALKTLKHALIVVADSREARVFSRQDGHDPLTPLTTLHAEGAPRPEANGEGERGGHMQSDNRPGGVTMAKRMDPLRKRHMAFAHQLSEYIDEAIGKGSCEHLVVAASCPFLGELRSALSERARHHLHAALDVDLTSFGLTDLEHRLDEHLRLAPAPGAM